MFKHRMFPELEVEVVATPKGRYYRIHDGTLLPSVTTILGRMISKDGLAAWRKRIGNPEADRISGAARQRGSILHDAVEKLVLNEPIPEFGFRGTGHVPRSQAHLRKKYWNYLWC